MKSYPDKRAIPEHAPAPEEQALTDDHSDNRHVHRITNVAVPACDHQLLRWKDGRWRSHPWSANRTKESNRTAAPAAISTTPTARAGHPNPMAYFPRSAIHQGRKPATIPGANTKNTAEPRTANNLLLLGSSPGCLRTAHTIYDVSCNESC
jgi:hypothetical protein